MRELYDSHAIYRNTSQLPHPSLDMWTKRLSSIPDNVYSYVSIHHAEDESKDAQGGLVDNLAVVVNTKERQRHIASFGITVKEGFHGQGIGKALMNTLIDLADNWLNLHRIELTVYTDNEPAIVLYKKFGFVIEGEAVDVAFRDGEYVNSYYMARIKHKSENT